MLFCKVEQVIAKIGNTIYESVSFVRSHIIPNFFKIITTIQYEDGSMLVDMVYLQRQL